MSLDNNTTGLNEILNMAKNLPLAGEGGEAVQEIVYVSADINYSSGGSTVTLIDCTVEELFEMVLETPKKYVILSFIDWLYLPVVAISSDSIAFGITFPAENTITVSFS